MIIDVNDPFLNRILNACLFAIGALALLSLFPWTMKSGKNRWTLVLPLLGIVVYAAYEYAMPNNWDIRLDLVLIWPVLIVIVISGLLRGILVWWHRASVSRPAIKLNKGQNG